MNELTKQFSADLLKDFTEALGKGDFADVVSKTKEADAEDVGTFDVIISTSDLDRQGDEIDQSKWDLTRYKLNPVVLDSHDYQAWPIAICTDISVEGGKLRARGKFAPTPKGQEARTLYEGKFLRATSVGYMQYEDGSLELLEFSFVSVPANPFALSTLSVYESRISSLKTKGIFITSKAESPPTKAEDAGDPCEMDDGTPGVLAEEDGKLVCVPEESGKSKTNQPDMNKELIKTLEAEHDRHAQGIAKAVDEFSETCVKEEKFGEKGDGADNSEYEKAIQEFKGAIDEEHDTHQGNVMKAIDDNYELEDQKPKKAIDEFKAAFDSEHEKHVKAFHKAIKPLKEVKEPSGEEMQKAIDEFTKAAGTELERHKAVHMELCKEEMGEGEEDGKSAKKGQVADELQEDQIRHQKYEKLDHAFDVFYAFTDAYLEEATPVEDFEKLLDEAVSLMKGTATKTVLALVNQSSKRIPSKLAIAALKELSSKDGGEGKEQTPQGAAPKPKVEVRDIRPANDSFEAIMAARRVLRTVDNAVGIALEDLNKTFREKYPARK